MIDYEQLVEEIYWLIGRADPTDADLRGAALQVSWLIERKAPGLAKNAAIRYGWGLPLYGDDYLDKPTK